MNVFNTMMSFTFTAATPEIRTLVDSKGDAWFVAQDICEILEIKNNRDACKNLDEDEKLVSVIPTSGQAREVILVNLSGLFNLVSRSNKPQAKVFSKWIRSDLLPNLFKQGYYFLQRTIEIPETAEGILSLNVYLDKQEAELKKQMVKIRDTRKTLRGKQHEIALPYQHPANNQISLPM